jgi:hypothetical protein
VETITDTKALAVRYIEACGSHDYATVSTLLAGDVKFTGPAMQSTGSQAYMQALQRMAPIWERSDVREAFNTSEKVCVVYDFVTNTPAGTLTCVEVLTFRGAKIAGIELFFDPVRFAPAVAAMKR